MIVFLHISISASVRDCTYHPDCHSVNSLCLQYVLLKVFGTDESEAFVGAASHTADIILFQHMRSFLSHSYCHNHGDTAASQHGSQRRTALAKIAVSC